MEIEDFSYIRCKTCGKIMIFPISEKCNSNILLNMCEVYDKIYECCTRPDCSYSSIEYGITHGYIKITDLPLALRNEFPPEVTHEFACGKHSLVVTKHNGDKITVSIEGNEVIIDIGGLNWNIYNIGD